MKKLDLKRPLNIVAIAILILVPLLKFLSKNLQLFEIIDNYDKINPAIVLYLFIPILLIIYILELLKSKRKLDIYDYIFWALILTGLISTVFALNTNISLFGKVDRHEGFLTVVCYYLLFINYKNLGDEKTIKKIYKTIIIIGIINCIYSFFQVYTNFNFIFRTSTGNIRVATGLCINQNFMGTLMVTILCMIIGKFLMEKKVKILDVVLLILFYVCLENSQSSGPFLAFILTLIFMTILLFKKKLLIKKNLLIVLILVIVSHFSISYINKSMMSVKHNEISVSGIKTTVASGGSGRLEIWKNSLNMVKKNAFIGVGFDNFYLSYPQSKKILTFTNVTYKREIKTPGRLIIDNAHNVYLHTLISTGILGLIPYLLLLLLTFIQGLKSKNKMVLVIFGGFVAYSVQAFVNISVIQIAPIYYILIGLILNEQKNTSYIK